jgi:hypothetical protein
VKKKPSRADSGFAYSRTDFEELVDHALAHARKLGATDAAAEASEGCGLSVSVRKGELENVERNRDKSLGITVYLGQRRGNASTSDFSRAALERTVQAAYDIARFTASDPAAGLPNEEDIARVQPALDLFHPWALSAEKATELALECEAAALQTSSLITNSEGAGVSAQPFFQCPQPRLSGWLCLFAAQLVGRPDCRHRRSNAARCLVQLNARSERAGQRSGGGALRRRAGAVSPQQSKNRYDRMSGLVRVARGGRAVG